MHIADVADAEGIGLRYLARVDDKATLFQLGVERLEVKPVVRIKEGGNDGRLHLVGQQRAEAQRAHALHQHVVVLAIAAMACLYPALFPGCRKLLPQVLPVQGIDIDLDKQSLRIDGSPCTIQKLDLALLDILHRNMGQCVAREQIKQAFWPTDDNANEKIDTHIKTIRKVLRDFPRYRLVTVRGKGYYLECTLRQA